jgi:aminoacyl tRNA synthase complex-interacting multifunctional protein 1
MSAKKGALGLLNDLIAELEVSVSALSASNLPLQPPGASAPETVEAAAGDEEASKEKKTWEKKKGGGGAGRPVKVEPNPPPKDVDTVNALDFRVGIITKVSKHETADKLYCEEIDIGEAEPRQIASGLVPHYTVEQMLGRRLIVVANLKPRNLVGFKSYGMVLCAATPDASHPSGEKVEFVDPPAGAMPGDRVVGEGLTCYDPLTPAQVEKQKAWEKVGALLRVDEQGVAQWNGVRLVVAESSNPAGLGASNLCTAPNVRSAPVR